MMSYHGQARETRARTFIWNPGGSSAAAILSASSTEEKPQGDGPDEELEDAARAEHEYLRRRLREELGREPTEEEMDEWLRRHTEGY